MGTLGTITIKIFPLVFVFLKGLGKHVLRLVDLHPYFGQITEFEWCAILVYQSFDVKSVEYQVSVYNFQTFLRKIECLLDKVGVCVIAQFLCWY
jgi:hypothetical protein